MNSTLRPDHQCSALCGMYALPALLVCDMNPAAIEWNRGKPVSAVIDGLRTELGKTFENLESHGYIETPKTYLPQTVVPPIKVTDLGTEDLRAWNNGEAGL